MRIDSAAEFTDYWRGVRERTTRAIAQIFGLTEGEVKAPSAH
jgi:hypothetical protein